MFVRACAVHMPEAHLSGLSQVYWTSSKLGTNLAPNSDRVLRDVARTQPQAAKVGRSLPTLSTSGQKRHPCCAKVGPMLISFGRIWPKLSNFHQFWPKSGKIGPILVHIWSMLAELGRDRPKFGKG